MGGPDAGAGRSGSLTGSRRAAARLGLSVLVSLGAAACGGDVEQQRLCARLVPVLEAPGGRVEILRRGDDPAAQNAVIVHYRVADPSRDTPEHWVSCRFAGGGFDPGRLDLIEVATDREGTLSGVRLYMLRRFWLGSVEARAGAGVASEAAAKSPRGQLLYFLQQIVNAIVPACVYGLLAVGYTLVYGIIGRINLAFGEIAMIGAFGTVIGVTLLAALGASALPLPLALPLVLLFALMVAATYGWATERLVFRPLRAAASQAPLIATIGLAIFLQEYLRLAQGARERWLQPVFTERIALAGEGVFPVFVTVAQILILGATAGVFAAVSMLLARSGFGRGQRACADDSAMAALCGVDVDRTIGLTFALGAAFAAAAGFIVTLYYGGVGFHMGFLLGFKALVAAIVGGFGSVPGAMLGGLLVALLETFWSAYLTLAYKDIAVFGLLALFLVLRPNGLLGQRATRGD